MAKKSTRTLTSTRINTVLLEKLDSIAMAKGRTRSELIDRAIEEFIERQEQQQPKKPAK